MAGIGNGGESRRIVRFCMHGHEIIQEPGTIARSRCPICGSPIDKRRPPVSYEELQKLKEQQEREIQEKEEQKLQQEQQEEQKQEEQKQEEQKQEEQVTEIPQNDPQTHTVPDNPEEVEKDRKVTPRKPIQIPGGTGTRLPGREDIRTGNRVVGVRRRSPSGIQSHAETSSGESSGFFLDYFGDKIEIPTQGAWIGREGLGRQWFDGNLMISRKHVYVRPNLQTGRLQIQEDKSLNGVFYAGPNGERLKLEGARMMEPGDILWIYNIPLRIER